MAETTPRSALKGWKSIAGFFGRDPSTVMRWSQQRGLPVRRLPGAGRSSVYALPEELAAWLAVEGPAPTGPAVAPCPKPSTLTVAPQAAVADSEPERPALAEPQADEAPRPARRTRLATIGAAVFTAAAIAGVFVLRPATVAGAPAPFRDAATERAYLSASYDLGLRTPASLVRARAEFGGIIARDPTVAVAYARLGETYLLLREYTPFPSAEAYRKAAAAAQAATALDPDLLAAHRVRAFVAFWGDRDIATARAEFARARALDPHDAQTWHWYATTLSANGEQAAALDAIREARQLDPASTPIAADYGLIAYLAGHRDEGLATLHQVAAATPDHMSTHQYLADIALASGDGATYLAETATACRLKGDAAGAAAVLGDRAAFAHGGMAALLAELAAPGPAAGGNDRHFALAKVLALQGRAAAAVAELRRALAADETAVAALHGELALRSLAGGPAFEALRPRASLVAPATVDI